MKLDLSKQEFYIKEKLIKNGKTLHYKPQVIEKSKIKENTENKQFVESKLLNSDEIREAQYAQL